MNWSGRGQINIYLRLYVIPEKSKDGARLWIQVNQCTYENRDLKLKDKGDLEH